MDEAGNLIGKYNLGSSQLARPAMTLLTQGKLAVLLHTQGTLLDIDLTTQKMLNSSF
jgi:hypothetical protein